MKIFLIFALLGVVTMTSGWSQTQATLTSPTTFPIIIGGQTVGSTTAAKGTSVTVLQQTADKVQVSLNGTSLWVDKTALDLPAPAAAATATSAVPAPVAAGTPVAPAATPIARQLAEQQPTANPFFSSDTDDQSQRRIKIHGRFDVDNVMVRGNKLWIQVVDYEKPTELVINGVHWTPVWNGKKSNEFEFSPPIVPFGDSKIKVKQLLGRSLVEAPTMPSAGNQETLTIKIVDQPVGTDIYEVTVHW